MPKEANADSSMRRRFGQSMLPVWITTIMVLACSFACTTMSPPAGIHGHDRASSDHGRLAEELMQTGLEAFGRGAFDLAASKWSEAAKVFAAQGRSAEQCDALIKLSRSQQAIGLHSKAIQTLEEAWIIAERLDHPVLAAKVMGGLGNVYIAVGPPERAAGYLNEALVIARARGDTLLCASILNNIGNLHASAGRYAQAVSSYLESASLSESNKDSLLAGTALGNAAAASLKVGDQSQARIMLERSARQLRDSNPSHERAFGLIGLAVGYLDLDEPGAAPESRFPSGPGDRAAMAKIVTGGWDSSSAARKLLEEALGDVLALDAPRAASYAWGYLGRICEHEGDHGRAFELTQNAVHAAQKANAPESLYRWQWQAGRILRRMGDHEAALNAYRDAGSSLQSIRSELTQCYGAPPVSFREVAGPLYLELLDLLLEHAGSLPDKAVSDSHLMEARDAVEMLKVYELRDYYHDECVDAARRVVTPRDAISKNAVIVYPIILENRLELLVSLPGGLKRYPVAVSREALTREVRALRGKLEKLTTREYLPHAQKIYRWLIGPVEEDLRGVGIESLVFVPDGPLRTIPMAALHDGRRFLIEKYALAITPGIDLTDPRPLLREGSVVLALGLTEPVQGFPPLPHVLKEIEALGTLYEGKQLIDEGFILPRMAEMLAGGRFTILHIASHGVFTGDVADSFLLTYDGRLTMDRLDEYVGLFRFREVPLELLTLSACDTAAGDERAALGLAGLAVKSGARSALATLWHINDEASSALVVDFYNKLSLPGISRAKALQGAQNGLLKDRRYEHPGYWAPFLLINNWL